MDYNRIYQEFYLAFLKAAEMTGNDYKNLSWFGRNKSKQEVIDRKEAA